MRGRKPNKLTPFRICTKCSIEKPIEDFPTDKHLKSGYKSNCKSCAHKMTTTWRKANLIRLNDYAKNRYHTESLEQRERRRIRGNSEKAKEWKRNSSTVRVLEIKKTAQQRGLDFNLPLELGKDLVTDNCYYCGDPPELRFNGIDRVDNSKGYLEDNVVTACKYCNAGKLTRSKGEFEAWLQRAAKHVQPYVSESQ